MVKDSSNKNFIEKLQMLSLQGFIDEPDTWPVVEQKATLKNWSERLFPTQRDDYFLLSSNKDDVAVFNSLHCDLMNCTADL